MNYDTLDRIARRRASAKLGFLIHASVYFIVNLALFTINDHVTPSYSWHLWPLGGWGIGLAFHGLGVFFLGSGSRLKERMIERERRLLDAHTRADHS